MKLLLAPLFARSRMCKHCARLFRRENPGEWLGLYEFETLPPLGTYDPKIGFVPDFPALLLFDEFVIDSEARELLSDSASRPWLGLWPDLIRLLEADGALSIADVGSAAKARAHQRSVMLRRDLQQPARWASAMTYYDALTARAQRLLGSGPRQAQALAWNFSPDDLPGIRGVDGSGHSLSAILGEGQHSELEAHRDLYQAARDEVARQLSEVNAMLAASAELEVSPMLWAPYRRYLQEKFATPALERQQAGEDFFKLAFPAFAPSDVEEFSRLRNHHALVGLREEIIRASQSGDVLDPRYPQRVLEDVLRIEARGKKTRRILGWIASAIGMVPVPGLGLAASGVTEAASLALDKRRARPMRWFYLVSDGRGLT